MTPTKVLNEISNDQMRNRVVQTDPPQQYSIYRASTRTVTIWLDSSVATAFVLSADVEANLATMSGVQEPNFAEDYHDVLQFGALAWEYAKDEKADMAEYWEKQFTTRKNALIQFLVESGYLQTFQGQTENLTRPRVV